MAYKFDSSGEEERFGSIERLTRDLKSAALTLSKMEVRWLTDEYYTMQRDRIRAMHQQRTLSENAEPSQLMSWLGNQRFTLEKQVGRALDAYSTNQPLGQWARCAPPGSMVEVGVGHRGRGLSASKCVPIATLHDGDKVTSFNRHHACTTSPRPIRVGVRPYSGNLIGLNAADLRTEITPNHFWNVRLNRRDVGLSVYLMRSGDRFRVGRCNLFARRGKDYFRLGIKPRARTERAEVWILKTFSTEREAAVYEQFVSTQYGIN